MKTKYIVCFIMLWILQMAAAFWFCTQKQGFHEDEFYTYYSTARTNGFYVEDGKWMERDAYRNEFVVLPGERFQYGLVKEVQSWDVHPPMYYWVFHTVASLVPGVFSKWIGLSVNLFFHGINLILLTYLSYLASGRDERLPLLVTFVYGFSPAAMSGVVFIRMYEMLTTFVLLCAILHVRAVRRLSVKTLLAMAGVTYVGFLTQYYYFIFLFFVATAFCVWMLWRDRNIWNCLRYGVFQGLRIFCLRRFHMPSPPVLQEHRRCRRREKQKHQSEQTAEHIAAHQIPEKLQPFKSIRQVKKILRRLRAPLSFEHLPRKSRVGQIRQRGGSGGAPAEQAGTAYESGGDRKCAGRADCGGDGSFRRGVLYAAFCGGRLFSGSV